MKKSALVIIYMVLSVLGLILMKVGSNTGTLSIVDSTLNFSINLISLLGFISYILSFFLFTNIIVKFNLSFIMPLTVGIIQILTLLSGYLIFNENINLNGILGILLVISGIIIMNIKGSNQKE